MRVKSSLLYIAFLLPLLGLTLFSASSVWSQSSGSSVEISITAQGFDPALVIVNPGDSVHWTNETGQTHNVIADNGLFNSSNLVPGAGFSLALAIPGFHTYKSTGSGNFRGELRIVPAGLEGPPDAPANNHIPDITFPLDDESIVGIHPTLGIKASRIDILVGFTDTATVAESNAALQDASVIIAGGLPDSQILLVAAPDTPDFSALDAAIASLLSNPAIKFASMSEEVIFDVVPRAAESETFGVPFAWEWDLIETGGGSWGVKSSRFPQAWNLLEEIVRRNNISSVKTGVLDAGFGPHEDLNQSFTPICKPLAGGGQKCTATTAHPHGVGVSGTVGATYDNNSAEAGRSLGVVGGNPVAQLHGVNYQYGIGPKHWKHTLEIFDEMIKQIPDLRVINFSMGMPVPGFSRDPVTKVADASGWWNTHGVNPTCGPGPNDDDTAAANQYCTPNNEDDWLGYVAERGLAALNVVNYAAANNVLIVQAAGNDGDFICLGPAPDAPGCTFERVNAESVSGFGWASTILDSQSLPNPVISVEALAQDLNLGPFSNDNGHVSAPGSNIVTSVPTNIYKSVSGTSIAAPYVTALIGYMLAYDPSLSFSAVKSRIETWARQDVVNGQPRIDAFNAVMSIPGAIHDLVDVNGDSIDGNQRVLLNPDNTPHSLNLLSSIDLDPFTGENYRTAPDGEVNMKDLRRFRDAWLQICLEQGVGAGTDCSEFGGLNEIELNGDFIDPNNPLHPKKDLNFDRCVNESFVDPNCPTQESVFPRFDFNGDGTVSRFAQALVPLTIIDTLATFPAQATMRTDLQVLASQWEADINKTEGYTKNDLDGLMVSGDLEVHADTFFSEGATEVEIKVIRLDTNTSLPTRKLKPSDDFIIITAPANVDLELTASATAGIQILESPTEEFNIKAGQDLRVDVCSNGLSVSASPPVLFADGLSESEITAQLIPCGSFDLDGFEVEFEQTPSGGNHGSLDFPLDITDVTGIAKTAFTAGTATADYEITAVLDLGDGRTIAGSVILKVIEPVKVAYRWQQTILEFEEEGNTRWQEPLHADFDPSMGDCDDDTFPLPIAGVPGVISAWEVAGWRYCVDDFEFDAFPTSAGIGFWSGGGPQPDNLELKREGVIEQLGNQVLLDETVSDSTISGDYRIESSYALDGVKFGESNGDFQMTIPEDQRERYQDHPLSSAASIELTPDGLLLTGLNEVAELEYLYDSRWKEEFKIFIGNSFTAIGLGLLEFNVAKVAPTGEEGFIENDGYIPNVFPAARGAGLHRTQLMLVPRGDGTALQFALDVNQPLLFPFDENNGFQTYQYCDVFIEDYIIERAYASEFDKDKPTFQDRGRLWVRNQTYNPTPLFGSSSHEAPLPVGPGHSVIRYSFVAIPYVDEAELQALIAAGEFEPSNSCENGQPPDASFGYQPDTPEAGQEIEFFDLSTSEGNSIVLWDWDFGDNSTSDVENPTHIYSVAGTYTVMLTVVDAAGKTDTASELIVVAEASSPSPNFALPEIANLTTSVPSAQPLLQPISQVPPTAAFSLTVVNPEVAQQVTFINASKDSGGQLVSARIDFGDGSSAVNLIPGGSITRVYANDGVFTATLVATDSVGNSLTVQRDITVNPAPPPPQPDPDFNLTIFPSSQQLGPGDTANFVISVAAVGSFDSPVDLTISSLPNGVTALFNPATVIPSGTSILNLTAANNADTGNFQFTVTGEGGGFTHTLDGTATVNFGLIPICRGVIEGTVYDAETGDPIPFAEVRLAPYTSSAKSATADANGHYIMTNLTLGFNNAPATYVMRSVTPLQPNTYWHGQEIAVAECGIVNIADFTMVKLQFGGVIGNVVEGIPDPNNLSIGREVFPTNIPIASAGVSLSSLEVTGTDENGFYDFGPQLPNHNNAPRTTGNIVATKGGYWRTFGPSVVIEAGKITEAPVIAMVPICTVNVTIRNVNNG